MKGSGVARLKQHIAGGFSNIEKCEKCPVAISRAMREHLNNQKKENEDVLVQKAALSETLLEPIRKKFGLDDEFVNEEESDEEIFPMEREHLKISIQRSIRDIHETESGLGRTNLHGSFQGPSSSRHAQKKDKSLFEKDDNILRTKSQSCGKKTKGLTIEEMDPVNGLFLAIFLQMRLLIRFIKLLLMKLQEQVLGVKGPTPYEITGPILDAELEEIQEYVNGFKKKWETYDRDANYIYELMDDVVEEIGEKYVVQVITDNGSAYKKAGELLMRKRKHLYWTPCAAHCIDLILEDFVEKTTVKVVIEQAKKISNFIYNHGKVLDIMRKYTDGKELLRPGITHFATNYISMESILEQKSNLQWMFTSKEWSKNAGSKDPSGKAIQDVILNSSFWNNAELVCNLHAPVSKVFRIVDGEKQATMGYVFEGMRRSKLAIEAALPRSHKKYCLH
ncbi:hypothetical protein Salat_1115000 [Sesamum alatum]|uniref:DUF659 domain-containing protein n=1 Tax=Sesamum alatum TaxID=300844 RepID=A0AAE1YNX7_9LAMI|nr:hypothetical protein Salat_1115000 [Sesamum alatum]